MGTQGGSGGILPSPVALLTYFNDGVGGGESTSDVFGSEILAKSDFFGSMKDAGIFLGCKKKQRNFFGLRKRDRDFFEYAKKC